MHSVQAGLRFVAFWNSVNRLPKMWLIPSYSVPGTSKFCLADWPGLQGDFRGYTGGLFGIARVFVGLVALGRHMSYWQHNKHA